MLSINKGHGACRECNISAEMYILNLEGTFSLLSFIEVSEKNGDLSWAKEVGAVLDQRLWQR